MASVNEILLRVVGDADDARDDLAELAGELAAFSKIEAEAVAGIDEKKAQRDLRSLREELRLIDLTTATPEIRARVAQSLVELDAVQRKVDALDGTDANVDVNVRRDTFNQLNLVTNAVLRQTDAIRHANNAGKSFGGVLSEMSLNLGPFSGKLTTMAAVLASVVPVLVSAAAALAAMAGSAVMAAGGLGALAVAFGGFLVPAIGAVVAGIFRFKDTADIAGTAAHALKTGFEAFRDVGKTLLPAIDPALRAIGTGLRSIAPMVKALAPAFESFGRAAGRAMEFLFAQLSQPGWAASIGQLVHLAGGVLKPLVDLGLQVGRVFLNIAVAAMPVLQKAIQSVADSFRGLGLATNNIGEMREIIRGLVSHLSSWMRLAGAVANVMISFFTAVAPVGQKIVDSLADGANALADWIKSAEGQEAIQQFFSDVMPLVESVASLIGKLVVAVLRFTQVMAPVLAPIVDGFSSVVDILNFLLGLLLKIPAPVRAAIGIVASLVVGFSKFVTGVRAAVLLIVGALGLIGAGLNVLKSVVVGAFNGIKSGVQSAWNTIKGIVSGGIDFVLNLPGDIVSKATQLWNTVKNTITRAAIEFLLKLPQMVGAAQALWSSVKGIISRGISFVFSLPGNLIGMATSAWNTVKGIVTDAIEMVIKLPAVDTMKGIAEDIWNAINDALPDIEVNIDIPKPSLPDLPGSSIPFWSFGHVAGTRWGRAIADALTAESQKRFRQLSFSLPEVAGDAALALSAAPVVGAAAGAAVANHNETHYHNEIYPPEGTQPDAETTLALLDAKIRARAA